MKDLQAVSQKTKERIPYLDVLRVWAAFAVILLHTSSYKWSSAEVSSLAWQTFNFFDSAARWCVPCFVMISGALFLKSEYDFRKLFGKNILRLAAAFAFWTVIYALVEWRQGRVDLKGAILSAIDIERHYHLWFLLMIIGLYLIVPFLKKIVESETLTIYFLALSILFTILIPTGIQIVTLFSTSLGTAMKALTANMQYHFTLGFVGYFVGGYVLAEKEISPRLRKMIYALGVLGFAATVLLTAFVSLHQKEATTLFYNNHSINVMLESVGVFVFARYVIGKRRMSKRFRKAAAALSKYTLGAYLVHIMVLSHLDTYLGIHTLSFHPFLSVPLIALLVGVISFGISFVLNHIPGIKRYIV